jgi:hypothetical protein
VIRVVTIVVTLLAILVGTTPDPATGDAAAPSPQQERRAFTVTRAMAMNDPTHHRGQVARQLRTYIKHAPRGSTISIMSFYLASSITWPALRAAYQRGVDIRAVLAGGDDGTPQPGVSWEGAKLTAMIRAGRAHGRRGSWVVWTNNTARGRDSYKTTMHAKFWQFSRIGQTRKVTMIGSYNNSDAADARAYSAMATLADAHLYDVVQDVFQQAKRDRRAGANPFRERSGDGWDVYFMPSTPISADNDPVMKRLEAIPADENTRMVVSMYSWQGRRGAWIARRMASMLRRGAHLTVVVGPDMSGKVKRILRGAHARLEDGCWRTGRTPSGFAYTHDKEMTATWVEDGVTQYAAWVGSDDWGNGPGGSQSDQATIGLFSRWAYDRLTRLLAPQLAHEPNSLAGCNPLPRSVLPPTLQ